MNRETQKVQAWLEAIVDAVNAWEVDPDIEERLFHALEDVSDIATSTLLALGKLELEKGPR